MACESCGALDPTKLRDYYADGSGKPSGTANMCAECYHWTPADQVAANILLRLGMELTTYLKEELSEGNIL